MAVDVSPIHSNTAKEASPRGLPARWIIIKYLVLCVVTGSVGQMQRPHGAACRGAQKETKQPGAGTAGAGSL